MVEAFLIGRCGRTEREAALTGYHEYVRLREGKERELQEQYEVARWICFNIMQLNPNIKPYNKPKTLQAYARFPWERMTVEEAAEAQQKCGVSEEEAAVLNRIFDEIHKRRANEQDR